MIAQHTALVSTDKARRWRNKRKKTINQQHSQSDFPKSEMRKHIFRTNLSIGQAKTYALRFFIAYLNYLDPYIIK